MYAPFCNPYDLLAVLIQAYNQLPGPKSQAISACTDEQYRSLALQLLSGFSQALHLAAAQGLEFEVYSHIEQAGMACHNHHVLRWLILELDRLFTWQQFANRQGEEPFSSMNDNAEHTQVILLPKVPAAQTHFGNSVRKSAGQWYSPLNEVLTNCRYLSPQRLVVEGVAYTLENVIYQPELTAKLREHLFVAFSPLSNLPKEELLDITYTSRMRDGVAYYSFTVNGVRNSDYLTQRFFQLYRQACLLGANIVMAPELLCSEQLFAVDEDGYNEALNRCCQQAPGRAPALILSPTHSAGGRNQLRVYDSAAHLLLTQDKQYPFLLKHNECVYEENLENASRQIQLLHIPTWGRLAFPICMDFLHPAYRDLLIRDLGATLLLCPSYTAGSSNFELAMGAGLEFKTACAWGNSCSALYPHWGRAECVGAVQLANVGEHSGPLRLSPVCQGNCNEDSCCVFFIDIPLNCAGRNRRQDIGAAAWHYIQACSI